MTKQEFTERYHYDASADLLGEGGFGRVYRAYDNDEHEYVALKMQAVDPKRPELRLRKEFDKVQQYRHRYIARYKECYTFTELNGDMDVAVMKYYKDGSLDMLLKSGKLGIEERYTMLRQILEGIAFLHAHGIIHRDLKPQNILIVEHNGRYAPLITDFGISKQLAEGESSAVSNSILGGTYTYASPEQLKETEIRKNTDLWSFGVIAYQMLTGTFPFNSGTFSSTSQEGRNEQFRQMTSGVLPEALNNVPEPWQRLIRMCLVVDNNKRIAHAEDCMAILNTPLEDVTVDESTIVETPVEVKVVDEHIKVDVKPNIDTPKQKKQPKPSVPKKRSRLWLWLLLLVVTVGGVVGYMMFGGYEPESTHTYSVGDYYNENGKKGVVFEVWDGGRHGKIVSLDQTKTVWDSRVEWDDLSLSGGTRTYADSESDGKANTDKIMARADSQYFHAFTWCRAKGSSWYLPAFGELMQIYNNKETLNSTLSQYGTALEYDDYWSSTEKSDAPEFYAWGVCMYYGDIDHYSKSIDGYVRAVSAF